MNLLLETLRIHPLAAIYWPRKEMQLLYADAIAHLGGETIPTWVSKCHKPFGFVDGYVIEIGKDGNSIVERSYWNVKNALDCVMSCVVRTPDGLAISAFANLPGGASELNTIAPLIARLRDREQTIRFGMILGDTAYRALDKQDCLMATHSAGEVPDNWAGGDLDLNNILARICFTHRQFIGTSHATNVCDAHARAASEIACFAMLFRPLIVFLQSTPFRRKSALFAAPPSKSGCARRCGKLYLKSSLDSATCKCAQATATSWPTRNGGHTSTSSTRTRLLAATFTARRPTILDP